MELWWRMVVFHAQLPKKGSEPEARSVSAHNSGAGAWERSGLRPTGRLPQHQGHFPCASLACILAALSSSHPRSPSPAPHIHLYCTLEGAQLTQISSAVIGLLLTSASVLSAFNHSDNDSFFLFSRYHQKTKRNSSKSCAVIFEFSDVLLWEIKFIF